MDDHGSDLERLIASPDATALERRLLEAWAGERPTQASRAHVLAALAVTATTTVTTVGALGSSVAPKALAAGSAALVKWGVVGAIVIGAATAGTYVVTRHGEPARPVVVQTVRVIEPRNAPAEPAQVIAVATAAVRVVDAPHTHASPVASTLTQQIAAVDRARAALDGGDAERARKLVDAYEAEFPSGAFTQEAEVVRIDALVRDGSRAEAERVGKHFLAAYPKSPHAARVRALLGYE